MRDDIVVYMEELSEIAGKILEPIWTVWKLLEALGTSKWVELEGNDDRFIEGTDVAELASTDLWIMTFISLTYHRREF